MSQAERNLKKRIEHMAPVRQRQKSVEEVIKVQSQASRSAEEAMQSKASSEQAKIDGKQGSVEGGDGSGISLEKEKKIAPPRVKKIRVTTSDGRQVGSESNIGSYAVINCCYFLCLFHSVNK